MTTTAEWLEAMKTPPKLADLNPRSWTLPPYLVVKPPKVKRERVEHPVIVHIAPAIGTGAALKALCGLERGRACKDPATTTLTIDRYCSNCWRAYAQPRLVA